MRCLAVDASHALPRRWHWEDDTARLRARRIPRLARMARAVRPGPGLPCSKRGSRHQRGPAFSVATTLFQAQDSETTPTREPPFQVLTFGPGGGRAVACGLLTGASSFRVALVAFLVSVTSAADASPLDKVRALEKAAEDVVTPFRNGKVIDRAITVISGPLVTPEAVSTVFETTAADDGRAFEWGDMASGVSDALASLADWYADLQLVPQGESVFAGAVSSVRGFFEKFTAAELSALLTQGERWAILAPIAAGVMWWQMQGLSFRRGAAQSGGGEAAEEGERAQVRRQQQQQRAARVLLQLRLLEAQESLRAAVRSLGQAAVPRLRVQSSSPESGRREEVEQLMLRLTELDADRRGQQLQQEAEVEEEEAVEEAVAAWGRLDAEDGRGRWQEMASRRKDKSRARSQTEEEEEEEEAAEGAGTQRKVGDGSNGPDGQGQRLPSLLEGSWKLVYASSPRSSVLGAAAGTPGLPPGALEEGADRAIAPDGAGRLRLLPASLEDLLGLLPPGAELEGALEQEVREVGRQPGPGRAPAAAATVTAPMNEDAAQGEIWEEQGKQRTTLLETRTCVNVRLGPLGVARITAKAFWGPAATPGRAASGGDMQPPVLGGSPSDAPGARVAATAEVLRVASVSVDVLELFGGTPPALWPGIALPVPEALQSSAAVRIAPIYVDEVFRIDCDESGEWLLYERTK